MDNSSSNLQQSNINYPQHNKKTGNIFIAEFIILIIVIFLMFVGLNYFKILPFSSLFPRQDSQPTSSDGKNSQASRLKINCPSVKEFCEKGQGIVKDQYVGIGYKLASGSAIFAAFDGDLTATSSSFPIETNGKTTQQNFKVLYLDNPDLRLRAIYFFRGKAKDIKTGKISKGEQIAITSGKPIIIYDNSSLIFSLIPGYPGSNTPAILNKENFE